MSSSCSQGDIKPLQQPSLKGFGTDSPEAFPKANPASQFEAYLSDLQRFGIQPGLQRIRALLAQAGDPHLQYPVVLIGGTNGKGSTCEFLARGLAAEGKRVGLYTSPHLYSWNERIRVLEPGELGPREIESPEASKPLPAELFPGTIPSADLDELFVAALPFLEAVSHREGPPTEFETLTFMGFWHFARRAVDVAVVEVGLGGLWDATNVTNPLVSAVTHVALDHCDRLGHTLEAIAADKVAIARPGRLFLTSETRASVLRVLSDHCEKIGARFWPLRAPDRAAAQEQELLAACLAHVDSQLAHQPRQQAQHDAARHDKAAPANFQAENSYLAAVLRYALGTELNWPPTDGALPLAGTSVPGRAEEARQNPLVVLDGANNPDGAAHLGAHLRAHYPNRKFVFVIGISADKDCAAMLEQWAPLARRIITTQATHPRAAATEALAELARKFTMAVEAIGSVPEAIERALALAAQGADCDAVCICGSFFLLAEVDRERITSYEPQIGKRRIHSPTPSSKMPPLR